MNLVLKILLYSVSFLISHSIIAQHLVKTGIILNEVDSTPVKNAHIINKNANTGTKSNLNGVFTITAQKEDTLLISYIGYQTIKSEAFKMPPVIYLKKEVFTLKPLTVLPYKDFKEFKDAFTQLELKDTVRNKLNKSFMLSVQELRSYVPPSLSISFYRNKDKENYQKLIAKDKRQVLLDKKFNPQLIERITNLKDSSIVNDFMFFCDFSNQFIEQSSTYELINQTFKCYEEYKHLPIASK